MPGIPHRLCELSFRMKTPREDKVGCRIRRMPLQPDQAKMLRLTDTPGLEVIGRQPCEERRRRVLRESLFQLCQRHTFSAFFLASAIFRADHACLIESQATRPNPME